MIQDEMGEAFDHEYGRMSGFLGVETPNAQAGLQNMILYPYTSPPTEILDGVELPAGAEVTPITTNSDGTQIWKFTHNGVDTHPIHFHLYDVQLINRVGWDGIIRKPDLNELGWKDTVRISPLEDTIVALRPIIPRVPFDLPNSIRLIDPSMPEGAYLANTTAQEAAGLPIFAFDPNGEPIDIINHPVNFGWEYVVHCHILSHEEMDMMHSVAVAVAPKDPSTLSAAVAGAGNGRRVDLSWSDNSANETGFIVQRAASSGGPWATVATVASPTGSTKGTATYSDIIGSMSGTFFYRVQADNVVGDTWDYTDPALNEGAAFPTKTVYSGFSNTTSIIVAPALAAPTNLTAAITSATQIRLNWTDASDNETSFAVWRSVNGAAATQIATVTRTAAESTATGGAVTFYNSGVTAGNTYAYYVTAVNAAGSSAPSNTATVNFAAPAAPAGLTGAAVRITGNNTQDSVTLNWTDNADNESRFQIQQSLSSTFAGATTFTVGANVTTFSQNVSRALNYYYRVRATNVVGNSGWSNAVFVTTP
ncbi:multicopper oxidase domain-containing protein [Geotalea toluenoxydans]|uniref:multicopper oxidase domain-containing protein n=1 Tax=Geotalea toluenoxydans TaxID=421624 RepID=UPI001FB507C3|nr:multicopper oxidase domain-containing protein [Geotalea toluenoxydans]